MEVKQNLWSHKVARGESVIKQPHYMPWGGTK